MSVLTDGLPASFFRRRNAVLAGIAIGVIFIVATTIYLKTMKFVSEPKTAPACYGRAHVPGTRLLPTPSLDRLLIAEHITKSAAADVLSAMKVCTAQSCPTESWVAYRSAIKSYVFYRQQNTSKLYREFSDPGLQLARQMYRQSADVAIVEGMQARYKASIFRLNDFNQYHAAITILTLKGAEALRPCNQGEAVED